LKKEAQTQAAIPAKRIGFVVESPLDGADHKILNFVAKVQRPDIEPVFRFNKNKGELFRMCRDQVSGLIQIEKCESVFVVWDLWPCDEHLQKKGKASCVNEVNYVKDLLDASVRAKAILLCITYEMDAWLLPDGAAVQKALSTKAHSASRISDDKNPEHHVDPKVILDRHFKNNGKPSGYQQVAWGPKIMSHANFQKIERRCPSFARLLDKLGQV